MNTMYVRLFATSCISLITNSVEFEDVLTLDDQTGDRGGIYALVSQPAPEVLVYPDTYQFRRAPWGELVVSPPLDDRMLTLNDVLEAGIATVMVAPPGVYWIAADLADRIYEQ